MRGSSTDTEAASGRLCFDLVQAFLSLYFAKLAATFWRFSRRSTEYASLGALFQKGDFRPWAPICQPRRPLAVNFITLYQRRVNLWFCHIRFHNWTAAEFHIDFLSFAFHLSNWRCYNIYAFSAVLLPGIDFDYFQLHICLWLTDRCTGPRFRFDPGKNTKWPDFDTLCVPTFYGFLPKSTARSAYSTSYSHGIFCPLKMPYPKVYTTPSFSNRRPFHKQYLLKSPKSGSHLDAFWEVTWSSRIFWSSWRQGSSPWSSWERRPRRKWCRCTIRGYIWCCTPFPKWSWLSARSRNLVCPYSCYPASQCAHQRMAPLTVFAAGWLILGVQIRLFYCVCL